MRILRPHGSGFVSLTPGEAVWDSLFRALWWTVRLIVRLLWRGLVAALRLADRFLRWAAWRYRMHGGPPPPSNVVPLRKR